MSNFLDGVHLSKFEVKNNGVNSFAGKPYVTVVIPLYNQANLVTETLDSVYSQTEKLIDLVIVNDCSTDNSVDVVERWLPVHAPRFRRVTLLSNEMNSGLPVSRNNGICYAETEYVFVLDSDNIIYPRALEKLLTAIQTGNGACAFSQLEIFGGEKGVGYAWAWEPSYFREENFIDAMALVRRDAWQLVKGYSQLEGVGWEDYDFWCKFVDHDLTGVFVPEILCRYRVRENSMLRSETRADAQNLSIHLAYRHPWLRLDMPRPA